MIVHIRRSARTVAVVLALGALGACDKLAAPEAPKSPRPVYPTASPTHETRRIRGTLRGPTCSGGWFIERAPVEIRNERNELVATTTTSANINEPAESCLVRFTLPQRVSAYEYRFRIGGRAGPTYPIDQLARKGWQLRLAIGDPDGTVHDAG